MAEVPSRSVKHSPSTAAAFIDTLRTIDPQYIRLKQVAPEGGADPSSVIRSDRNTTSAPSATDTLKTRFVSALSMRRGADKVTGPAGGEKWFRA